MFRTLSIAVGSGSGCPRGAAGRERRIGELGADAESAGLWREPGKTRGLQEHGEVDSLCYEGREMVLELRNQPGTQEIKGLLLS